MSEPNNKELVAAGHQFARLMSSDMPLIDIAKMITRLAERLDCTTAALRETAKQRVELTADNVARAEIIGQLVWQYSASGIKPVEKSLNPASALLFDAMEVLRQPATEAAIVELKAQGVDLLAEEMARTHAQCQSGGFFDRQVVVYEKLQSVATAFAQQLRNGEVNHD